MCSRHCRPACKRRKHPPAILSLKPHGRPADRSVGGLLPECPLPLLFPQLLVTVIGSVKVGPKTRITPGQTGAERFASCSPESRSPWHPLHCPTHFARPPRSEERR